MEWEHEFTQKILQRGYDCYQNDQVLEIYKTNHRLKARVESSNGRDEYDVEIGIENDEITDMNCDCEYAQNTGYCKHIAAVLYAYENDEDEEAADLVQILDRMEKSELEDMLYTLAQTDRKIKERIERAAPQTSIEHSLRRSFKRILHKYGAESGFIEPDDTYAFSEELLELLEVDVETLSDRFWQTKLNISAAALHAVQELEVIDYAPDEAWLVISSCQELWERICSTHKERHTALKRLLAPCEYKEFMENYGTVRSICFID